MEIFDGRAKKSQILAAMKLVIEKEKLHPVLAIILVGDDEASKIYIRLKKKAGNDIKIDVRDDATFRADADETEILAKIEELNNDPLVHGIIVQLPLPKKFDQNKIINAIDPKKDVDGFHPSSAP